MRHLYIISYCFRNFYFFFPSNLFATNNWLSFAQFLLAFAFLLSFLTAAACEPKLLAVLFAKTKANNHKGCQCCADQLTYQRKSQRLSGQWPIQLQQKQ